MMFAFITSGGEVNLPAKINFFVFSDEARAADIIRSQTVLLMRCGESFSKRSAQARGRRGD